MSRRGFPGSPNAVVWLEAKLERYVDTILPLELRYSRDPSLANLGALKRKWTKIHDDSDELFPLHQQKQQRQHKVLLEYIAHIGLVGWLKVPPQSCSLLAASVPTVCNRME
jgi:hypothetical protein